MKATLGAPSLIGVIRRLSHAAIRELQEIFEQTSRAELFDEEGDLSADLSLLDLLIDDA